MSAGTSAGPSVIYTRYTYRKLPGPVFAGALWQRHRLVWQCGHQHERQDKARACAARAADAWPGRRKVLNGPCQVPSYYLPWLPDSRDGARP